MKWYTYITFLLLLFTQHDNGDWFFQFDKIHHYQDPDGHFFDFLPVNDTVQTELEKFGYSIFGEGKPYSLKDTAFIDSLILIGFEQINMSPSKESDINHIYKERYADLTGPRLGSYCLPNFTDILIFKKQGKITGISKVCFGCSHISIVGTDKFTAAFGENGEYQQLEKVLYDKE